MIPASVLWWLFYHAGLSNPGSPWYLFWSGIGADWARVGTIFTAIGLYAHHHNYRRKSHHK